MSKDVFTLVDAIHMLRRFGCDVYISSSEIYLEQYGERHVIQASCMMQTYKLTTDELLENYFTFLNNLVTN